MHLSVICTTAVSVRRRRGSLCFDLDMFMLLND
jgi:hypothetical protein